MGTGCSSQESGKVGPIWDVPTFKVVLIGDPEVGKSSVFLRYTKNQFDYSYQPTQEVAIGNVVRKLNVPEQMVSSVTLWDCPGREDMDLRKTYYRNSHAAIVVVDTNDPSSIDMAITWKQDFLNNVTYTNTSPSSDPMTLQDDQGQPVDLKSIPVLLLGNKYDVIEENIAEEKTKRESKDEIILPPRLTTGVVDRNQTRGTTSESSYLTDNHTVSTGLGDNTTMLTRQWNDEETMVEKAEEDSKQGEDEKSMQNEPPQVVDIDIVNGESFQDDGKKIDEDDEEEELPECLKQLQKVSDAQGFVGCVVVSACDGDGSVPRAIQALVRHLVDRRIKINPVRQSMKAERKSIKKRKKGDYVPLTATKVNELDPLFERCDMYMKRVHDYSAYYELALRKFKQACADAELVTESKPSLEDCIIGLKSTIGSELQVEKDEEFIKFVVPKAVLKTLSREIRAVLNSFEKEFGAVCKAVMREGSTIEATLQKLDKAIKVAATDHWRALREREDHQEQEVRRKMAVTEHNRAKIIFHHNKIVELTNTIQNSREKIHAALLW